MSKFSKTTPGQTLDFRLRYPPSKKTVPKPKIEDNVDDYIVDELLAQSAKEEEYRNQLEAKNYLYKENVMHIILNRERIRPQLPSDDPRN